MKKIFYPLVSVVVLLALLVGCAAQTPTDTVPTDTTTVPTAETTETTATDTPSTDSVPADDEMFTDRDRRTTYDESDAVLISLQGDTATASSNSVRISGSTVTITEAATYVLSGHLTGTVIVDADKSDKIQLVLNGAEITSETSAAIYVKKADKVFLTLADNTTNTLSNGGTFEAVDESNIDAAVFSKDDLTLNGSGSLSVASPGGHGITCKDDLVITGGAYTVQTASHGLQAKDSIRITGETTLCVTSGKDALHCENKDDGGGFVYLSGGSYTLQAEGDGISAQGDLTVLGGSFDILAGGGSENGAQHASEGWGGYMGGRPGQGGRANGTASSETTEESTSMKGIKSEGILTVSDGKFVIDSADDAVHSNADIRITGGDFTIATGDDGMHADENLTVSGGSIDITESYEGLEALHLTVSGGVICIVSTDDGLNAAGGTDASGMGGRDGMMGDRDGMMGGGMASSNGTIVISGGDLYINASGDGIDANGTLEISGGHTVVVGPTQGDTATLDFDKTGTITGGTFIGTGASMMAQTFTSSTQGVISLSVGNQSAGTQITLRDASGNVLVDYSPELPFQIVILSTPEMVSGETYSVTVGSASGDFTAS